MEVVVEEEEVEAAAAAAAGAVAGTSVGADMIGGGEEEGVERGSPLPKEATILPPPPSSNHTANKSWTTPLRYPGREEGSKDEALGFTPAPSILLPLPEGVVGVEGKSSSPG